MTAAFSPAELDAIQAEFPALRGRHYLNHASVGPLPVRARKVIDDFNDVVQRMDRNFDPHTDTAMTRSRAALARLIGADAKDIGLVASTSAGINWALGAFALKAGDAILITDHEFPALVYPSVNQKRLGVELVIEPVAANSGLHPDQLEAAFRAHPNIKVVAVSWVSFHNGFRHDLEAFSEIAHRHGAYLLADIIQGLGTRPLDAPALGIDIATASVHKWMLCPVGQAFVWARPESLDRLDTPWAGWMSIDWQSDYCDLFGTDRTLASGARRAEVGTANFAGVRALAEVAEWIADLGTGRIATYTQTLLDELAAGIDPERYEVVSDRSPEHRSSIFCLRPRRRDVTEFHRHLLRSGVVCALREGAVRISPHFRTDRSEIEHLVQSLREFN